jgi:hypothetical protein
MKEHPSHTGPESDDDSVVANGGARDVVASATDLEILVASETHRRNHIGASDASGDQRRAMAPFQTARAMS